MGPVASGIITASVIRPGVFQPVRVRRVYGPAHKAVYSAPEIQMNVVYVPPVKAGVADPDQLVASLK